MPHINSTLWVGLGAVGSAAIGPVAAMLHNDPDCWGPPDKAGKLTLPEVYLCDGDKYEEKNLKNQCISPGDVGMNKAEYAALQVNGLVSPEVWPRFLEGHLEIVSWLVTQRTKQQSREEAGVFGGVALIVIPVDDDWCRHWIYKALDEVPKVNVLVLDPSNGAGDEAHSVDVVTYLRCTVADDQVIELWPSPMVKYKQLQKPKGRPAHTGCAEKAESQPQLRTSNMMAAMLLYDCLQRFLSETGMPEAYVADTSTMEVKAIGGRIPPPLSDDKT